MISLGKPNLDIIGLRTTQLSKLLMLFVHTITNI